MEEVMKEYIPKKASNFFAAMQGFLYRTLSSNEALAKHLKVFHQVPKDTPYPYIYIGRFSVINRSTKTNTRMIFVNEVHIYAQNCSAEELLNWSHEIKDALAVQNVLLSKCNIVEVDFLQMSMDIMSDSKTYRVVSKFRTILEEVDGRVQRQLGVA
jgi:hypothetical protein